MIACECKQCGKALKVKDELAGKKVKCPECGQPVPVSAGPKSASITGGVKKLAPQKTPPPSKDVEERTLPPRDVERSDPPRPIGAAPVPPTSGSTPSPETLEEEERPIDQAEMTDFLAPAQGPDEIGRLGPYRILKILGAGGMGVVYMAEDPGLQRLVAVKAMLPSLAASASARERFLREARAAAAIKHDHIVTIHQVAEDRGAPYLAMEFLSGEPLDVRLKRERALPVVEVIRIGKEVALALEAAHRAGMIHRDIKPGNVFLESATHAPVSSTKNKKSSATDHRPLSGSGRVKILDFGLARAASGGTQLTQQGAIIGTPAFMAPEQASGKDVDHRCDLFSLGCVLYRMSTGELPFKGDDTVSTLMAVATSRPSAPRDINRRVPAVLSRLIMDLLEKKPNDRPASAHEVFEALDGIVIDETMTQPAELPGKKAKRAAKKKKRTMLIAAGAGGAVVALLLAFFLLFNRGGPKETDKPPIGPVAPKHPADHLRAENVAEADKVLAGGGDAGKAPPSLVAALPSGAGRSPFTVRIGIAADGSTLTSLDGTDLIVWDLKTGKELARHPEIFPKKFTKDTAIALAPYGNVVVWDDGNDNAGFFDLKDPKRGRTLRPFPKGVEHLKSFGFNIDGSLNWLIPEPLPAAPRIFATEPKRFYSGAPSVGSDIIELSPDNRTLVIVNKKSLVFHPLPYAKVKGVKAWSMNTDFVCYILKYSPDGKTLATVSGPGFYVSLIDPQKTKEVHQFPGHTRKIRTIAFNPDGTILASGGEDGVIRVWDTVTHKELDVITLPGPGTQIHQVLFTPEGTHLAAATNLGRVFVFRLAVPAATRPTIAAPEIDDNEVVPRKEKKRKIEPRS